MNRKIALSSLSIMGALLIMGGATFAAFTTQATMTNNTFASGNASLLIAVEDESNPGHPGDFASTKASGFGANDVLIPGFDKNYTFWLKNDGSTEVALDVIGRFISVSGSEALQDAAKVMFTCERDDGQSFSSGQYSVNAWEAGQDNIVKLNGNNTELTGSDTAECQMNVTLPISADNSVAGKTMNFSVRFEGTQTTPDASPDPSTEPDLGENGEGDEGEEI